MALLMWLDRSIRNFLATPCLESLCLFPVPCAVCPRIPTNIQRPPRNQLWPTFLGLLWIRPCCLSLLFAAMPSMQPYKPPAQQSQLVLLFAGPGIIGMHHHDSTFAFMTLSEPPRKVGKHLHKPQILAVPRHWKQLIALERSYTEGSYPTIRHVPHAHSSRMGGGDSACCALPWSFQKHA